MMRETSRFYRARGMKQVDPAGLWGGLAQMPVFAALYSALRERSWFRHPLPLDLRHGAAQPAADADRWPADGGEHRGEPCRWRRIAPRRS